MKEVSLVSPKAHIHFWPNKVIIVDLVLVNTFPYDEVIHLMLVIFLCWRIMEVTHRGGNTSCLGKYDGELIKVRKRRGIERKRRE